MPEQARSEEAIFLAASQLATAHERDAYLRGACGDDEELRQRLGRLLAAHDVSRGPLDLSPPGLNFPATVDQPILEKPGARIGPYKLLQQIGEGGMGVVFMAEQTEPVQRKVALKLIKPGMDTRQVVARFEAERQALALMDHVNIARVLDAGATEAGRPYFVMELVHGVPITRYCDDNRLTPRQRLELFIPVCQAIQHAHQKGIIHRDVKPSNVMITLYDGKPVPKIIDFGVAKATEQRLTERTLFTQYGTMIGTFEYMSPEQAEMSGLGVDTRSDVYSLGVLMYELLAGSTPLTHKRIKEAAYDEVLRMIREEEPPKPSTRLSESGEALASISARRHTDPARLTSLVRGELDWIVMKCLEKDRNRRYESASAFAADVQRYLSDEPVQACPPSAWYRCRKFARRNKAALAFTAVVLATSIFGVGIGGWMIADRSARQARVGREVALFIERADAMFRAGKLPEALAEIQKAHALAETSEGGDVARREALEWKADLEMATRLEEIQIEAIYRVGSETRTAAFGQAFHDYGIDVVALSTEEAAERIAASRIQADLILALENWIPRDWQRAAAADVAFRSRLRAIVDAADPDPWRRRCRRAIDDGDLPALLAMAASVDLAGTHVRSLLALGSALHVAKDYEAASAFLRKVQRLHPENVSVNLALLASLSQLKPRPADDSIGFARAILAIRPDSQAAHAVLARQLDGKGRTDKGAAADATATLEELVRRWPDSAFAHLTLGQHLFVAQSDYRRAAAELSRAIELRAEYALAWNLRGAVRQRMGELDAAIDDLDRAIELAPENPGVLNGRGLVYAQMGNDGQAIADFTKAIELRPDFAMSYRERGRVHAKRREWASAIADFSKAVELRFNDPVLWRELASAYREAAGQDEQALAALLNSLELNSASVDDWIARAEIHIHLDQWESAIVAFSKAIELRPDWHYLLGRRGGAFIELGERERGLAEFSRWIELKPEDAIARIERAKANNQLGAFDAAIADFTKAIELKADYAPAWIERAYAYAGHRQWEPAIADFTRAIALHDRDLRPWIGRAHAYRDSGQVQKALGDFAKVVELNPKDAGCWVSRGEIHSELMEWEAAIFDFTKAIEVHPDWIHAWYGRGWARLELNRPAEAFDDFSKAIESQPKKAIPLLVRARAYHRLKEHDRALVDVSAAIELDPKLYDSWQLRGSIHRQNGRWELAVADFTGAIDSMPEFGQAWFERGWGRAELNDWKHAAADFAKATELSSDGASYWREWGIACLAGDDLPGYRTACGGMFERLGNLPEPATAAQVVAVCAAAVDSGVESGRLVALAELACTRNREWNVGLLGAAYYRAARYEAAIECFAEKARANPPRAWDMLFLAMANASLGRNDAARDLLAKANEWIDAAGHSRASPDDSNPNPWFNWQEEAECRALVREAQVMIAGPP